MIRRREPSRPRTQGCAGLQPAEQTTVFAAGSTKTRCGEPLDSTRRLSLAPGSRPPPARRGMGGPRGTLQLSRGALGAVEEQDPEPFAARAERLRSVPPAVLGSLVVGGSSAAGARDRLTTRVAVDPVHQPLDQQIVTLRPSPPSTSSVHGCPERRSLPPLPSHPTSSRSPCVRSPQKLTRPSTSRTGTAIKGSNVGAPTCLRFDPLR
jgi:hypothetical protein